MRLRLRAQVGNSSQSRGGGPESFDVQEEQHAIAQLRREGLDLLNASSSSESLQRPTSWLMLLGQKRPEQQTMVVVDGGVNLPDRPSLCRQNAALAHWLAE